MGQTIGNVLEMKNELRYMRDMLTIMEQSVRHIEYAITNNKTFNQVNSPILELLEPLQEHIQTFNSREIDNNISIGLGLIGTEYNTHFQNELWKHFREIDNAWSKFKHKFNELNSIEIAMNAFYSAFDSFKQHYLNLYSYETRNAA